MLPSLTMAVLTARFIGARGTMNQQPMCPEKAAERMPLYIFTTAVFAGLVNMAFSARQIKPNPTGSKKS